MNNELLELETEFQNVPIEVVESNLNKINYRIKNDPSLEKNSIPILQKRADLYRKYIEKRKKEQQDEFKKSNKVEVKKPLTLIK